MKRKTIRKKKEKSEKKSQVVKGEEEIRTDYKLDKTSTSRNEPQFIIYKFLQSMAAFVGVMSAFAILFMLVIYFISPTKVPLNSFFFFFIILFLCIGYLIIARYLKKKGKK